jgi:hypothetical protein
MLAHALGCFGEVLAGARPIDEVIHGRATTLQGDTGFAVCQDIDITGKDELDGGVNAPITASDSAGRLSTPVHTSMVRAAALPLL